MFCVSLNQWVRAFLSLSNGWERWKTFFLEIPVGGHFSTVVSRSDTNSDAGPHPLCHISIYVSNTHIMHDNAHSKSWREHLSCKVSGPRNEQWYVLSIKEITELAGGKWMTDTSPTQTLKNTFIVSKLHWLSEPSQQPAGSSLCPSRRFVYDCQEKHASSSWRSRRRYSFSFAIFLISRGWTSPPR